MNKINKKIIIYILISTLIIGIYYLFTKKEEYVENTNIIMISKENIEDEKNIENKENIEKNNKIIIYVTGAVKNEGIYEIEENSRIADSIKIAGGLKEDANIENINLAYVLEDGMKIHIPSISENINEIQDNTNEYITKENGDTKSSKNSNEKININTATQTELETLPGIGPSTALKILDYRKENGKFNTIEDIKKVNGIGESKFSKIKDLIKT